MRRTWLLVLVGCLHGGCLAPGFDPWPEEGGKDGSGGASTGGSGDDGSGGTEQTGSGGDVVASGGGSPGSGGTDGADGSGGATGGSGGDATGGGGAGGTGGEGTGGMDGTGGTDACTIGQTDPSQVAVIGDSFFSASQIIDRVVDRARTQGSLGPEEEYVDKATAGQGVMGGQLQSQYASALSSSGTIKTVLMTGGLLDCQVNGPSGANAIVSGVQSLLQAMATGNTEKVLYVFYANPVGNFTSITDCLDAVRPELQALCEGSTTPECFWLDLGPIWDGHHEEYSSDGLHATTKGSEATGDAIWDLMVEQCIAQ